VILKVTSLLGDKRGPDIGRKKKEFKNLFVELIS
jgi:hypothetical protein